MGAGDTLMADLEKFAAMFEENDRKWAQLEVSTLKRLTELAKTWSEQPEFRDYTRYVDEYIQRYQIKIPTPSASEEVNPGWGPVIP